MGNASSSDQDDQEEDLKPRSLQDFIFKNIEYDPVVHGLNPLKTENWNDRYLREQVYKQTREHAHHDDPDRNINLFYYVTHGNYERLVKVILDGKEKDPPFKEQVNVRDAVGGNIIHVAYLYKQWKIARFLVENFPDVAAEPYDQGFTLLSLTLIYLSFTNLDLSNLHLTLQPRPMG